MCTYSTLANTHTHIERVEKECRDREKPTQQRQILTVIYEAISLRRFLFCFSLFAFHPLCNLNNMAVKMLDSIFFLLLSIHEIRFQHRMATPTHSTNTQCSHTVKISIYEHRCRAEDWQAHSPKWKWKW